MNILRIINLSSCQEGHSQLDVRIKFTSFLWKYIIFITDTNVELKEVTHNYTITTTYYFVEILQKTVVIKIAK